MGFWAALRERLTGVRSEIDDDEAGGESPDDDAGVADDGGSGPPADPREYDRVRWRRRMQRVLDELPGSKAEWDDLIADGRALGLGEDWMRECQVDEFILLVRRSVKDRVITPPERRRIELARLLMGLSHDEADSALRTVIAEAESFFGKPIQGA